MYVLRLGQLDVKGLIKSIGDEGLLKLVNVAPFPSSSSFFKFSSFFPNPPRHVVHGGQQRTGFANSVSSREKIPKIEHKSLASFGVATAFPFCFTSLFLSLQNYVSFIGSLRLFIVPSFLCKRNFFFGQSSRERWAFIGYSSPARGA